MKQTAQIKSQNSEGQNFTAARLYPGESENISKTYIDAQLFLENRAFFPYPNGVGGVEKCICEKHAKYGMKLMDENKKMHSIFFNGHWSAMIKQEES